MEAPLVPRKAEPVQHCDWHGSLAKEPEVREGKDATTEGAKRWIRLGGEEMCVCVCGCLFVVWGEGCSADSR
jgi:hypothetical protein